MDLTPLLGIPLALLEEKRERMKKESQRRRVGFIQYSNTYTQLVPQLPTV